jgi:guanosine-3',5'-bis(diphosphate) 3'-pyrophosphohydrolase
MDDVAFILKAVEFAAIRHRTQTRKGEDRTPYINHPIGVANLLANEAGEKDRVLLTAAILHDVIEDTVNSIEEKQKLMDEISEKFGEQVLSVTMEVTDDKTLDKKVRKQLQIDEAKDKSDKAKKLKIADKIMNIRDLTANPPSDWPLDRIIEYMTWSEKVVSGLRGENKILEDLFDECLLVGRLKYEEIIN